MSLACAVGEHRGSAALPDLALHPLPQPLNIPLVLDHDSAVTSTENKAKRAVGRSDAARMGKSPNAVSAPWKSSARGPRL